jgi:hypothetical protein
MIFLVNWGNYRARSFRHTVKLNCLENVFLKLPDTSLMAREFSFKLSKYQAWPYRHTFHIGAPHLHDHIPTRMFLPRSEAGIDVSEDSAEAVQPNDRVVWGAALRRLSGVLPK